MDSFSSRRLEPSLRSSPSSVQTRLTAYRDPVEQLFWELPRKRQQKLPRKGLIEVLDLVTRGEVDEDDLAQELSLQLSRLPEPVLFVRGRFSSLEHRKRFHAVQRKTFLTLVAPYRWRKRRERVVPKSDPRWQPDPERPGRLQLVRYAREFRHRTAPETAENREEERLVSRLELLRIWEGLERLYPEPVVLAALGLTSKSEAARELRMRKSAAIRLIDEARDRIPKLRSLR